MGTLAGMTTISKLSHVRRHAASAAVLALLAAPGAALAQSSATVVVNGQTVQFDQPPVEQNGRLFVPLRGVFERLGASVVYSNGQINATSGGTTIQLQVGSTQAQVAGTPTTLDAPPFLEGGRVLVPLRFISQALGASVNYVSSSQTVYVNQGGNQSAASAPRHDERPSVVQMGLTRVEPDRGTSVGARRPEISATFEQPVDASSVRIALDGRDVTSLANITGRAFVVTPGFDLAPGSHVVTLAGRIDNGPPFAGRWEFRTQVEERTNYINDLRPGNGARVASIFDVSGVTQPGSQVRILATSSADVTHFVQVNDGNALARVGTTPSGRFSARIEVPDVGTGVIDVRVEATAPDGSDAIRTLRLQS
jgi:hypothetical protein